MILIEKSASGPVMKAVIALLKSRLSIPVYDHVPEGAAFPYVVVSAVSEADFSDKLRCGSMVGIDIDNYAVCRESRTVQNTSSRIITAMQETDLDVEGYSVIMVRLDSNECASSDEDNIYMGALSLSVYVQEALLCRE